MLEQTGYTVNKAPAYFGEETLLFYREKIDSVFVLTFPPVVGHQIQRHPRPGSDLNKSALQFRAGEQQKKLATLIDEQKVVYLLGGIEKQTQPVTTLFIVREG